MAYSLARIVIRASLSLPQQCMRLYPARELAAATQSDRQQRWTRAERTHAPHDAGTRESRGSALCSALLCAPRPCSVGRPKVRECVCAGISPLSGHSMQRTTRTRDTTCDTTRRAAGRAAGLSWLCQHLDKFVGRADVAALRFSERRLQRFHLHGTDRRPICFHRAGAHAHAHAHTQARIALRSRSRREARAGGRRAAALGRRLDCAHSLSARRPTGVHGWLRCAALHGKGMWRVRGPSLIAERVDLAVFLGERLHGANAKDRKGGFWVGVGHERIARHCHRKGRILKA